MENDEKSPASDCLKKKKLNQSDEGSPLSAAGAHLTNKSTAINTEAVPSPERCLSETETDICDMEPFDDFEWRGLLWPEIDPLDLPGRQLGKEIKLKNFRWPPANNQRKGVVFIFHGYGSMASHMAIIAKYLA